MENELKQARQTQKVSAAERSVLDSEYQELAKQRTSLELILQDLESSEGSMQKEKTEMNKQLRKLEKDIEQKRLHLQSEIVPSFQSAFQTEKKLREEFLPLDQRRQFLMNKQGRSGRFRTKKDRNAYLMREISSLEKALKDQKSSENSLQESMTTIRNHLKTFETEMDSIRSLAGQHRQQMETLNQEWRGAKEDRDRLYERRKLLWRQDAQLSASISHCQEEVRRSERHLNSTMNKVHMY
jgi:structural maintenance of chromosome 3 (chondroitin sulfate proteoglycan 6)